MSARNLRKLRAALVAELEECTALHGVQERVPGSGFTQKTVSDACRTEPTLDQKDQGAENLAAAHARLVAEGWIAPPAAEK